MKICAQNPANPEYSLCGDAHDAPDTEDDVEPFRFAVPHDSKITCDACKHVIREIYREFTCGGLIK